MSRLGPCAASCAAIAAFASAANPGRVDAPAPEDRRASAREALCDTAATRSLVRRFVANYSAGHVVATVRLWAPEPRFRWFSTSGPGRRLGPSAYDRVTLAPYFRARARMHERIRVTELRAGSYDPRRGVVDFNGKLVRTADDLRPTMLDFKGAADCVSGGPSLVVWSM